ncbi:MAG: ribose-phosphate diphosphokinase [Candidatus Liptonbacteria bacterium]|nr:ribose-phosphate diphosphokinase [Candidatus Liptonbacteria bacterium]
MKAKLRIFSGQTSNDLNKEIVKILGIPMGKAEVSRHSDGEVRVQIEEDVRGMDVFIVNSTHPPLENLMDMLLLADAARRASAGRITLVPTYLSYNRQDRKDRPRVPISSHVLIQMLGNSGADRILLFDVHSEPTMGFFDNKIVVDHLYASVVSVPYLKKIIPKPFVVASPDKGGGPRAEAYARRLGMEDYVLFTKIRPKAGEINKKLIKIIGEVEGKNVLFVDDMIDTGSTLIADAAAAKQAGAKKIYALATHGVLSGNAVKNLDESEIEELIITNTIPHAMPKLKTKRLKITILPMAPLIAGAISRIHEGKPLSPLILQ